MNWIGTDEFKSVFAAAKQASSSQVELAIAAAEDELVELVGQAAVTDTLLASPTDAARAARLVRAHKFLAIAIHLVNARNVKREHDTGSAAVSGGMVINEYLTPKEQKERSDQWRAMALKAAGPYLTVDVIGDEFGPGIEYSHSETAAGSTCGTEICSLLPCGSTRVIEC